MNSSRRRTGRVSGRDVARAAGVSLNTVSLVVRNSPLVAIETKARVQEVIARLGYQPNAAAAALASARAQTLGYLLQRGQLRSSDEIEAVADVFHNQLLNAIIVTAQRADYHVLTTFAKSPALLDSGRIDGVLCDWQISDDLLVQLAARRAPAVVVGRDAGNIPVSWVKADEEGGAFEATRHLLALGHRRLGLLTVGEAYDNCIAQERVRGYSRALAEADLFADPQYVVHGDWSFESGYAMGRALLSKQPRPTAIFILSEILAAGALRAAAEMGLRVPHDLAIATTEDSPLVEFYSPRLTAVHVPMYQVGLRATEILLALLDDATLPPQQLVLPARLVVRESSVPDHTLGAYSSQSARASATAAQEGADPLGVDIDTGGAIAQN